MSPPDAPQKGSSTKIDTLDGRLLRSVSGIDPASGKMVLWVSQAVLGGAGSQVNWYEINATPASDPSNTWSRSRLLSPARRTRSGPAS